MSIKIMSEIWAHGPYKQTQRFVLLALGDKANDEGECWPSVARIAAMCCLTERGVRKIMRDLEDDGWLETRQNEGPRGTNVYVVKSVESRHTRKHVPPGTLFPLNENAGGEEPEGQKGGNVVPPNHHRTTKKSSSSHSAKKGWRKEDFGAFDYLSEVMSGRVAEDFVNHRIAIKKRMTLVAARRIAEKLRDHHAQDEVALLSIENGWAGVFPEKVKTHAGSTAGTARARNITEAAARGTTGGKLDPLEDDT